MPPPSAEIGDGAVEQFLLRRSEAEVPVGVRLTAAPERRKDGGMPPLLRLQKKPGGDMLSR